MNGRYQTTYKTCLSCSGRGYSGGYQTKIVYVSRYVNGRYQSVSETRSQYNQYKNRCFSCTGGRVAQSRWVPSPIYIAPRKPDPIPPPKQTIPTKIKLEQNKRPEHKRPKRTKAYKNKGRNRVWAAYNRHGDWERAVEEQGESQDEEQKQEPERRPQPIRPKPTTTNTAAIYGRTGTNNVWAAYNQHGDWERAVAEQERGGSAPRAQPIQQRAIRQSLSENRQSLSGNRNSRAEAPLLSDERIENQMQQRTNSRWKCQLKWSRKKTVILIVFIVVLGFAIAFLVPLK